MLTMGQNGERQQVWKRERIPSSPRKSLLSSAVTGEVGGAGT